MTELPREDQAVRGGLLRSRNMKVSEFSPFLWRCMYENQELAKEA